MRRVVLGIALVAVSVFDLLHWRARDTPASIDIGAAAVVRRTNLGVREFETSVPTVRVVASGCDGTTYGSGVIIAGGRVLTARHVVENADAILVEDKLGRRLAVAGVHFDPHGRDAALITLRTPNEAGARVAETEPVPGTSVGIIGHPFGGALHADFGRVDSYTLRQPLSVDGGRVMLLDTDFEEGMSGGPVLDDSNSVVGVAVAVETKGKLGIAVPAASLHDLLDGQGFAASLQC